MKSTFIAGAAFLAGLLIGWCAPTADEVNCRSFRGEQVSTFTGRICVTR